MSHKCKGDAHSFQGPRVTTGDLCMCGYVTYVGEPGGRGYVQTERIATGGLIAAPYIQPSPLARRLAEAEAVMRDMLEERGGTMRLLEFAREQVEAAHGDALAEEQYRADTLKFGKGLAAYFGRAALKRPVYVQPVPEGPFGFTAYDVPEDGHE